MLQLDLNKQTFKQTQKNSNTYLERNIPPQEDSNIRKLFNSHKLRKTQNQTYITIRTYTYSNKHRNKIKLI